jgi:hypothetical protein
LRAADVDRLLDEAIDKITVKDWEKCVQHSEKLQEADF